MNIYEKLAHIQQELNVPKNQYNDFGGYSYRSCEDILETVKPLLAKYRCTLQLEDYLENIGNRYYIRAIAKLIDAEKPYVEDDEICAVNCITNSAYAREEETKKGMDGSQITGASSSYARKYALNGLFLIDDVKDSDTTNKGQSIPVYETKKQPGKETPITESQLKYLNDLGVDIAVICSAYKVTGLEQLTLKQASEIIKNSKKGEK